MNILVTGAAGFIGSHVVDALLARGDRVVGLDNFDPYYPMEEKRWNLRGALASEWFRLVEADVADSNAVAAALQPHTFNAVVHLAAKVGIPASFDEPTEYARTNILGTHTMLELGRKRGARQFIFGSSSSVYGDAATPAFRETETPRPISPYATTKRAGELLCEAQQQTHGGSIICLRFFTVYGPRQRPDLAIRKFTTRIAGGDPVMFWGNGSAERDYTWIADVVRGVLAALDRGASGTDEFQIINLGGGHAASLIQVVDLIGTALRKTPEIVEAAPRRGDVNRTLADLTKARRLLGYEPQTAIGQGVPTFVQSFLGSQRLAATRSPPFVSP